jgi:hypothetical protein
MRHIHIKLSLRNLKGKDQEIDGRIKRGVKVIKDASMDGNISVLGQSPVTGFLECGNESSGYGND